MELMWGGVADIIEEEMRFTTEKGWKKRVHHIATTPEDVRWLIHEQYTWADNLETNFPSPRIIHFFRETVDYSAFVHEALFPPDMADEKIDIWAHCGGGDPKGDRRGHDSNYATDVQTAEADAARLLTGWDTPPNASATEKEIDAIRSYLHLSNEECKAKQKAWYMKRLSYARSVGRDNMWPPFPTIIDTMKK